MKPEESKKMFLRHGLVEKKVCLINGRRWESLLVWGTGGEIDDWE
jgi:hypothetical protein